MEEDTDPQLVRAACSVCAASKWISVCVLKEKFTSFQDKGSTNNSTHPLVIQDVFHVFLSFVAKKWCLRKTFLHYGGLQWCQRVVQFKSSFKEL